MDEAPRAEPTPSGVDETAADTGPVGKPAKPGEPPPAERIGKYEVVALLGRGGMGAVYQAFDPVLERDVALKVMLPQISEDPEQKQRFEREARAVARLAHANVVTVFDLGYHTDGAPYIVMELLKGKDLLHLMHRKPPLPLAQKISIVVQVLEGLGHAHKVGIVHRDIKPANVSISEDGTAKIMDFGIAHLGAASATAEGSILGTAAYMSPEQARGERVDGRSDLFAVGSLLCELVTGHRPFEAESIMATLYAIDHNEPRIELPAGPEHDRLRAVLQRALTKDRDARYATAAEFANELAATLDRPGVRPAPAPAPQTKAEAATSPVSGPVADATRTVGGFTPPARPDARPAEEKRPEEKPPADPTRFFRLLREVYVGGKSGQLHFTAGKSCRSLRILKGQIIHGTSDVDGEHLGDVLVRYGVISEEDRLKAVELVLRERRRLGEVLVGQGLLERERLEEALGLHVREILFSMLDGPEGSHSFEELSDAGLEVDIASPLSTGEVILEATRYVQDPELVRRVLGDTGRVLALSKDPLLRGQKITLTPTDGFIMSRVDGTLTAREVLSLSPVSTEDTERSLFGLLCTGVIDYQEKHDTARSRTNPARTTARRKVTTASTQPAARRATPPPTPPASTPVPAASRPDTEPPAPPSSDSGRSDPAAGGTPAAAQGPQDLRQLILGTHALLKRDHFEVLGLERSATDTDVRKAYTRFARVLHPDASRPDSLADLEEKGREVFLRVTAAYETLKDPEARRKYEIAFEPSKLRSGTTPVPGAQTPPPSASTPPPVVPAAETPPPPPAQAEAAPAAFNPAATLAQAEAAFAKEDYWGAIQKVEALQPQLQGPLRTRGVLLLARAYMKNPHWQKRAEEALLGLLRDAPECTPAYLFLAQIYAGQKLPSRARSMYRKVLEVEPDHQAARNELAKLDAAGGADGGVDDAVEDDGEDAGGGLLGWFKGRRSGDSSPR